ncbi:MAG: GtrA family protein [Cellulomonadaceae bacterium]|jgi:putative flippase GtrA|nr:GtrA family protein [Cellulomonadaceae bacterium]
MTVEDAKAAEDAKVADDAKVAKVAGVTIGGLRGLLSMLDVRDPAQRVRLQAFTREILRFGAVGGVAFVVNFGVFNLSRLLGMSPIPANIIATVIATCVAWAGNRWWTFGDHKSPARGRELAAFFIINLIGLVIETVPLGVTHYLLGLTALSIDNAAKFGGTVIGTVFRYIAYKKWVFAGR